MKTIELDQIAKTFDTRGAWAVDKVSASLPLGKITAVMGPSGAGKTTLFNLLSGNLNPDHGEVRLPFARSSVAQISQEWELPLEESLFSFFERSFNQELYQRFRLLVEVFHLQSKVNRPMGSLSTGQRGRAYLITKLVTDPKLVLMDEPFAHLDRELREEIERELRELQQNEGWTLVMITHDLMSGLMLADHLLFLKQGKLYFAGSPREFYLKPLESVGAHFAGGANLIASSVIKKTEDYLVLKNGLGEFRVHRDQCSSLLDEGAKFAYLFCRYEQLRLRPHIKDAFVEEVAFLGPYQEVVLRHRSGLKLGTRLWGHEELEGRSFGLEVQPGDWRVLPI